MYFLVNKTEYINITKFAQKATFFWQFWKASLHVLLNKVEYR